jgi:hypothetical protein
MLLPQLEHAIETGSTRPVPKQADVWFMAHMVIIPSWRSGPDQGGPPPPLSTVHLTKQHLGAPWLRDDPAVEPPALATAAGCWMLLSMMSAAG